MGKTNFIKKVNEEYEWVDKVSVNNIDVPLENKVTAGDMNYLKGRIDTNTNALNEIGDISEIVALKPIVEDNVSRLDVLEPKVDANTTELVDHESRLGNLENSVGGGGWVNPPGYEDSSSTDWIKTSQGNYYVNVFNHQAIIDNGWSEISATFYFMGAPLITITCPLLYVEGNSFAGFGGNCLPFKDGWITGVMGWNIMHIPDIGEDEYLVAVDFENTSSTMPPETFTVSIFVR